MNRTGHDKIGQEWNGAEETYRPGGLERPGGKKLGKPWPRQGFLKPEVTN